MKVTYSWIMEMAGLAGKVPIDEAAEKLTMLGMEVEAVHRVGGHIPHLVSGKVLSREPHPDSDHLSCCKVDVGGEVLDIVCGADNVAAGQLVPVAQVGCVLPGDFKIKKGKIRGAVSMGMICSKEELGLEEKSKGIWELAPGLGIGKPSEDFLGGEDAVFEVALTSNRSDCLSVEGLARELAAAYGGKRPAVDVAFPEDAAVPAPALEIRDPDLCGRYSARIVKGVKIGPAPEWMARRLEMCGIRSINNVVDVTNYVLLELGHPLHAFDLDRLDKGIIVRRAAAGETMTTLDGNEHALERDNLVIADHKGAVALAGVMGGGNSEVHEGTVNLLIESAWFNPVSVRRTAKGAGLTTEASYRFARTADWGGTVRALDRTVALILQTAGGKAGKLADLYPAAFPEKKVKLRASFLQGKLGFSIPPTDCRRIFQALDFEVSKAAGEDLEVIVPTFRSDVALEVDLVEEAARHYGYEKMPATIFPIRVNDAVFAARDRTKEEIRGVLSGAGLQEVINFNFVQEEDAALLGTTPQELVAVLNPMSNDQKLLRSSLLPNLIKNIRTNAGLGERNLGLFELGKVFSGKTPAITEELRLGVALWGRAEELSWRLPEGRVWDFYDLTGLLELLLAVFKVKGGLKATRTRVEGFHPGRTATLAAGGAALGMAGELHPSVMKELDLPGKILMMEVSLPALVGVRGGIGRCSAVSRFPSLYRDLAFVVGEDVPAGELMETIRKAARSLAGLSLISEYRGEQVGAGKKSLAFSLEFVNEERTLSDEEAEAIQQGIIKSVNEKHGGLLR